MRGRQNRRKFDCAKGSSEQLGRVRRWNSRRGHLQRPPSKGLLVEGTGKVSKCRLYRCKTGENARKQTPGERRVNRTSEVVGQQEYRECPVSIFKIFHSYFPLEYRRFLLGHLNPLFLPLDTGLIARKDRVITRIEIMKFVTREEISVYRINTRNCENIDSSYARFGQKYSKLGTSYALKCVII